MDERIEIEINFIESWIEAEEFYADLFSYKGWDYVKPIIPVIESLRLKGYDKSLRAGLSLYTFVLSRSIKWGLRQDQHSLIIEPTTQNKFRVWYSDGRNPINELESDDLIDNKTVLAVSRSFKVTATQLNGVQHWVLCNGQSEYILIDRIKPSDISGCHGLLEV